MKNDQKLAVCFFPTQVAIIDDNYNFLQNIEMQLSVKNIGCKSFCKPNEFISFFNDEYHANSFTQRCLLWLDEDDFDHRTIDINFNRIHQEIYNPNRFDELSVVISDYAMPNMNGLELLQSIANDSPVKRILLTGEADEKLAVEAFNSGLIDAFIRKDDPNFTEIVMQTISKLQLEYFKDLSELITASLIADPARNSCLSDPAFKKLFDALLQSNNYSEYYLIDEFGSFLFLDFYGKPSWLVVRDEIEMAANYETAHDYLGEGTGNNEVLHELSNRDKLLFLFSNGDTPPTEWSKYLYLAQKLQGRETYYYAVLSNIDHAIQSEKIMSYADYL